MVEKMNEKKKLVIKIGGSITDDLKYIKKNKRPEFPNSSVVHLKSAEELQGFFSPQRFRLLLELLEMNLEDPCVSTLAKKTNRKQAAISRDLSKLESQKLISKRKVGQSMHPKVEFEQIIIDLSNVKEKALALAQQ